MDPERVTVIKHWPVYHCTSEGDERIKEGAKLAFNETQRRSFEDLKTAMTKTPVLALPVFFHFQ